MPEAPIAVGVTGAPVFALFSGGHDSLTSTALAAQHPDFEAVVHVNTGIGVEETRQFVRDTCQARGWPLLEYHPDGKTYEQLVLERGFPGGPMSHNSMYYWLKQRSIRRLVREHKSKRTDRVVLVTGIRVQESQRRLRAGISVPWRRDGAQVWVNPILDWSVKQCHALMDQQALPRNLVVDLLHRSGECLCGALAHSNEIAEIDRWFPATGARIHALEAQAAARGLPAVWAARTRPEPATVVNRALCVGCQQLDLNMPPGLDTVKP